MRRGTPVSQPDPEPWSQPDLFFAAFIIATVAFAVALVVTGMWLTVAS
jgi:hypothetical protein